MRNRIVLLLVDEELTTPNAVMKSFLFSSILLLSLTGSLSAMADRAAPSTADIKRAASAYDQGRERYREGDYVEAAEQFEAADDAAPSAAALRLAMLSRKEAGQLDRALTHAALALELYPNDEELKGEAESMIETEGSAFGRVHVTCDSPCELLLNNRLVHGASAQERLIYVKPGSISMRAGWSEGRSHTETTDVYSQGVRELDFSAPEVPAVVAAPVEAEVEEDTGEVQEAEVEERNGWHPAVFWTSLGLTAASGGASVFLGLNAKNNPGTDAVVDKCGNSNEECSYYKQGRKNQMIANVAFGVTAALGVFTITSAFLTDWGSAKTRDEGTPDEKHDSYDGWNGDTWSYRDGDLFIQPVLGVGNGASLGATGTF